MKLLLVVPQILIASIVTNFDYFPELKMNVQALRVRLHFFVIKCPIFVNKIDKILPQLYYRVAPTSKIAKKNKNFDTV